MKQFGFFVCVLLFGFASAGYRYQNPGLGPIQPIRQNVAQVQFQPQQQVLPAPAPQHQFSYTPVVQQNYLPPQQQQQLISQPIQQQFISQPIPQRQQNIIQQTFQGLGQDYQNNQQQQQQVIVTKDIYIHSAPEEHEDIHLGEQIENSVPIRKNYRIVFIKAPSHNLKFTSAALRAQAPSNEEKTVIYVLSKRPDIGEVQQQIQQVQSEQKTHKPEVYFIKYKTQEEAQRAQQEIQAQYDALGGSTRISDEGVAPIRSVIGSVGGATVLNNGFGSSGNGGSFGSASGSIGVVGGATVLNNGFGSSGNGGSFGSASQQSFAQTNLEQSGSSNSFATSPSQKYLPSKAKV